jgi:probable H4MPT-linked C1 transfer pathway protein
VVPLVGGVPRPHGRTDPERLYHKELIYTGARRTPVCALLDGHGAAEFFATTLDVYLLLGQLAEGPADCGTADGRPATRAAAHNRLARMLCGDGETVSGALTVALASRARRRQLELIGAAVRQAATRLSAPPAALVLAGSGEFLARLALDTLEEFAGVPVLSLAERLGPALSAAACAHAVAVLVTEGRHG